MDTTAKFKCKKVRKARYATYSEPNVVLFVYEEIVRFLAEARIPPSVALQDLDIATNEVSDALFSDTPSWANGSEAKRGQVKMWRRDGVQKTGRQYMKP